MIDLRFHPLTEWPAAPTLAAARKSRDWRHNLRAIALGLGALRAVDRYGITERGEQYVGWKAIPASTGNGQDARALLVEVAKAEGYMAVEVSKALYRKALIEAHPDHGGSRELFEQVQDAGRKLGVS